MPYCIDHEGRIVHTHGNRAPRTIPHDRANSDYAALLRLCRRGDFEIAWGELPAPAAVEVDPEADPEAPPAPPPATPPNAAQRETFDRLVVDADQD